MRDDNIEYVPPTDESIKAFAQNVCERLAVTRNDDNLKHPEVVSGFTYFLKLAMRIAAKHRTDTTEPKTNIHLHGE